jgi:CheY-like chemotaxis protein
MAKPVRVLLVEDSEDDAELIALELQRSGYDATCRRVETEPEFRACFAAPFDVILCDYHLPAFDALRDEIAGQSESLRRQIDAAVALTTETMDQVRALAQNLRPPALDVVGLSPTLEKLCRQPRRVGLLGLQERFSLLQGRLEITSTPGQGTRLVASAPWREQNQAAAGDSQGSGPAPDRTA